MIMGTGRGFTSVIPDMVAAKGGTYRPSGAHQITICIGLPHQLLGNDIHHRISIGDNGIQLFVQTVFYDLGKHFTIHFMSFLDNTYPLSPGQNSQ